MNLEYLDDISYGGKYPQADPNQLVRLYNFNHSEIGELCVNLQDLVLTGQPLVLHTLSIIEPVNCNLTLRISGENKGITTMDKRSFYCDLTTEAYKQMILLLDPFCQEKAGGYQWLYDLNTDIDLLISQDGSW